MRGNRSHVEAKRRFVVRAGPVALLLGAGACAQVVGAEFDDLQPLEDAGRENDASAAAGSGGGGPGDAGATAGMSGVSGTWGATAGTSGADAAAGRGGDAGRGGGRAGTPGKAGSAGLPGRGGTAGAAGTSGAGGNDGGGAGGNDGGGGTSGNDGGGGAGGLSCQIPSGPGRGDPNRVVINEVYAEGSTLSDYVELLNTNSEVVDLSRLRVGDEACANADALIFPSETFIAPGGYIVVRGNQAAISGPQCCAALFGAGAAAVCFNAPFGINADGEAVSLCSADNIVVDEVAYPGGLDNTLSYSRFGTGDAGAAFRVSVPTPGSANR